MGHHRCQMIEEDLGHPIQCLGTHARCNVNGKTKFVVCLIVLVVVVSTCPIKTVYKHRFVVFVMPSGMQAPGCGPRLRARDNIVPKYTIVDLTTL